MTRIAATNITSPLGLTTAENYAAVKRNETGLKTVDGPLGVPGRFCVGMFSEEQRKDLRLEGFSWFESLAIRSIRDALRQTVVNPASDRTILILGTSTADIEELADTPEKDGAFLSPGEAARKIARSLGFVTEPLVASNACISGGTAQMLAQRLIGAGVCDTAVVCGVDVVSAFVLAGFDAFKALSPMECRPFDIERLGLNIGECAATLVLTKDSPEEEGWRLVDGCLNNDAYHVSAPIPSGDGIRRTVVKALTPEMKDKLACVTAHGTATMFNDQMESKGIADAGLGTLPTTAYKAHFGHTFGASGVVEAIITMCSLDEGLVLPVRGFEELGVSGRIRVCDALETTQKRAFVKTQSGFGGCNGALVYAKEAVPEKPMEKVSYETLRSVRITPTECVLDRKAQPFASTGAALISDIYKTLLADGSRFFKMDMYSRLAYVATGLLAKDSLQGIEPEEVALFVFTRNGSLLADRKHLSTFSNPEEFYPSPAVFINTLPNVVLGEIAVKNNIQGETTLVMLGERNDALMEEIVNVSARATRPSAVIYGWVDCDAEDSFTAELKLMKITK